VRRLGVGLQERGSVTEVVLGTAQYGEHEVQLLAVVGPLSQRRGRLDEQDLTMGVFAAVGGGPRWSAKSQSGVSSGHHHTGVPTAIGWDCDAALR
jgi:hypothetical protein